MSSEKQLIASFECPVCYGYALRPIYECNRHHIICRKCYLLVDRCPMCRSDNWGRRVTFLEKLAMTLDFPCKNAEDGCGYTGRFRALKKHEKGCFFENVKCPRQLNQCRWIGPAKDLAGHFMDNHPRGVRDTCMATFQASGTLWEMPQLSSAIFTVYERTFDVRWERCMDMYGDCLRMGVRYYGPASKKGFWCCVSGFDQGGEKVVLLTKFTCFRGVGEDEHFLEKGYYTEIDLKEVQECYTDERILHFSVHISKVT